MAKNDHGTVFTRRWVVDLMLDSCGYSVDLDLAAKVAVEPSCGNGAFLLPMVERLLESMALRGRPLKDAAAAIRAFDLQEQHVNTCRTAVADLLVGAGYPRAEATRISAGWVCCADYLLDQHEQEADFVIGNPPYIRSDDMSHALRTEYMKRCATMTVGSDIFVGFIERGLRSLKVGGVLSFICADRWMHNNYGKKLRSLVVEHFAVQAVYELHGVDAFAEEVSAYPAITQITNGMQGRVLFATANSSFRESSAKTLLKWSTGKNPRPLRTADFAAAVLPDWFETDSIWPCASPERLALIEDLEERFRPLEDPDTGARIGIGIATGADRVFVVEDDTLVEQERLLPLVATNDVKSGYLDWKGRWLVNPWNDDGSLVDLSRYPKLQAYYNLHSELLRKRHTAVKASHSDWFRTIDKVNPQLRHKPKLLLQDMKATIQPVLDLGDYYPHHNLYWITSEKWDLEVLGGLLLSRVAEMFVSAYGVKMRGGTLRFQAQYLRLIRVPAPEDITLTVKRELVRAFRLRDSDRATKAALVAYKLDMLPD